MKSEKVYAWLTGQDDNVGDSALRRGYVEALQRRGDLVAYVADASDEYISGLGLSERDSTEAGLGKWLRAALRDAKQGPVTIALNAGEFSFSNRYTLMMLTVVPALNALKRRGAKVVWLGAAVPRAPRERAWLFRPLFSSSSLTRWRDEGSSTAFAAAPWMPDWALALKPTGPAQDRSSLGVSMRFDRPYPSASWITAVRELASRLSLDVVVIAQVVRDSETAEKLARDLGGRAVAFPEGRTHAAQEALLRDEYAGFDLMISDRLHGLLIAATEGAVPLAWCEEATEKMGRHFRALGMPWAVVQRSDAVQKVRDLGPAELTVMRDELGTAMEKARGELADVTELLVAV